MLTKIFILCSLSALSCLAHARTTKAPSHTTGLVCVDCPTITEFYTSFNTNLACDFVLLQTPCEATITTTTLPETCKELETTTSLIKQTECFEAAGMCASRTTETKYAPCTKVLSGNYVGLKKGPTGNCVLCPTTTYATLITPPPGHEPLACERVDEPCKTTTKVTQNVPPWCPATIQTRIVTRYDGDFFNCGLYNKDVGTCTSTVFRRKGC